MHSTSLGVVHDLRNVVKWHDNTVMLLQDMLMWTNEIPLHFDFYTDGSASHEATQAASAVVLLVTTADGPRFGGFRAYALDNGAAPRAEACAVLMATWWGAQLAHAWSDYLPLTMAFHFDCLFAGYTTAGYWRSQAHLDVLRPARALALWIQATLRSELAWRHVPAHTGDALNEAADSVGWAVVNGWISAPGIDPYLGILTFDSLKPHVVEWLWFHRHVQCGDTGFPLLSDNRYVLNLDQPFSATPTASDHPYMARAHQEAHPATQIDFDFSCVTANVLTLFDTDRGYGSYISGRQEGLLRQFDQAGILCIGIQESRSQSDGHSTNMGYHILSAPATQRGVGGVQLWIRQRWPTTRGSLDIKHSDLRIWNATSRRLVVSLNAHGFQVIFIVAHAPSSTDAETLTAFWNTTAAAIPSRMKHWPVLLLADANARVGSQVTDHVGDHHATEENEAGHALHDFLHQQSLFLPQTFAHCHNGASDTWTHPNGAEARLDYIGLPLGFGDATVTTQVGEFDISLSRQDHLTVTLRASLAMWPAAMTKRHKKCLETDPLSAHFHAVPWNVDVHSHACAVTSWLQTHVVLQHNFVTNHT